MCSSDLAMNFSTVDVVEDGGALYASNSAMRIKVPGEIAGRLGRFKGGKAILGIRPEDLRMATSADSSDVTLAAVVEVSEQLGAEVILDVVAAGANMVASVDPLTRVKPQEAIKLALNPARLRFFDAATEVAI